jgi:uncharacterized protein with HEPN domain
MPAKPVGIAERLRDIVEWGEALARHVSGMTEDAFLADEKTQHAALKCVETIGEAAKMILKAAPDFDIGHADLDLKAAARARDRLAHGYRDIDLKLLWTTVTVSVPGTTAAARAVLQQLTKEPPPVL